MVFEGRFTPPEGSLLYRWLLGPRRGRVPPGGWWCGLRSDERGVPGVSRSWRYAMAAVDGDVLVYGTRRRYRLRLGPTLSWSDLPEGYVGWWATDRDSGAHVQIAADQRDAYKLMQSRLADP